MKRWEDVVRHAQRIYRERDRYAYLYGAAGEIGTDGLVERLWAAYPEHFAEFVTHKGFGMQRLKNHVRGRICLDCSAFICYITQKRQFEDLVVWKRYNSNDLRKRLLCEENADMAVSGWLLWKPGHVALAVGSGMCIDFGYEFVDCRLYELRDGGFAAGGRLAGVDYGEDAGEREAEKTLCLAAERGAGYNEGR